MLPAHHHVLRRRVALAEVRFAPPAASTLALQVRQALNGHAGAMLVVAARMRKAVISAVAAGARDLDALARAVPAAAPDLSAALAGVPAEARKAVIQQAEERLGAPMGVLAGRLIANLTPTT